MIVKVKQHLELRLTIKAGVLGVTGYTGQELVGLLSEHPDFTIAGLFSTSVTGAYQNIIPSFTESKQISKHLMRHYAKIWKLYF